MYMGVGYMIYANSWKGTWQDGRLRRYPTGRGEVDSCEVCTRIREGIVGGQIWWPNDSARDCCCLAEPTNL
jgi:hypothetical protein